MIKDGSVWSLHTAYHVAWGAPNIAQPTTATPAMRHDVIHLVEVFQDVAMTAPLSAASAPRDVTITSCYPVYKASILMYKSVVVPAPLRPGPAYLAPKSFSIYLRC